MFDFSVITVKTGDFIGGGQSTVFTLVFFFCPTGLIKMGEFMLR